MCTALVMVVAGVSMLANAHAEHRRQPRRQPVVAAVDRRRLRARARRAPAPGRRDRRPVRTPRRPDRRHRHLRHRVAARRRSSTRAGPLIGLPRAHRPRRRAAHARHALDHHQRVPARGAGQGGRHLGRVRRRRRHPRHPRVGRAARAVLVGLDLPRHRRRSRRCRASASSWSCRAPRPRSTSASTRAASVLSAIGIGLLVLGIIEGPERGWTNPLTLVGADRRRRRSSSRSSAVELRTDEPLLDPRLFKHRGFATGSASLFLQFFAMFGFFFVSLQFLQLVLGYSTFEAALALLPMSIVILPISCRGRHVVGEVRAPADRRHRPRGVGRRLRAVRHPRHRQRVPGVHVRHHRHRCRRRAGDDAGHQRDRRVAPPRQAGRRVGGERHVARARRRVRRRRARAARSTPATATRSTATSAGCRPTSRDQAREAPAIAVQLAGKRARRRRARPTPHARRSPPGCATRCSSGMALLLSARCSCGSAARPRTEEVLEDELDADMPPSLAPALSVPADGCRRRAGARQNLTGTDVGPRSYIPVMRGARRVGVEAQVREAVEQRADRGDELGRARRAIRGRCGHRCRSPGAVAPGVRGRTRRDAPTATGRGWPPPGTCGRPRPRGSRRPRARCRARRSG